MTRRFALALLFVISPFLIRLSGRERGRRHVHDEPLDQALHRAIQQRQPDRVRDLLAQGADANARDAYGQPALWCATARDDARSVEWLLRAGAAPDRGLATGTPLLRAALYGQARIVNLLLAAGASVATRSDSGATALIQLASLGHAVTPRTPVSGPADATIAAQLLDHGADVNAQDAGGWSALMFAARRGDLALVSLLLDAGADPHLRTERGETALSLSEWQTVKEEQVDGTYRRSAIRAGVDEPVHRRLAEAIARP